jgi:integrase
MPRRRAPPRLYLDPRRRDWIIRDGASFIRTGHAEAQRERAERQLAEYLGAKWRPTHDDDPRIADILIAYGREHLPHTAAARKAASNILALHAWWSERRVADVTAANCRAYAATKTPAAARRDLETLRAAIHHWHREHGPLASVPALVMPPKPEPRSRWLTRGEAARLLWAARRTPQVARFVLLDLYTGTRLGALLALEWSWVDLDRGRMHRRAPGVAERATKRTPPVRLGRRILSHLRRWKRLDDPRSQFVIHFHGRHLATMQWGWRAAVARAGLTGKVTPHTLRHTRATWLMQAGVSPWEASVSLGMSLAVLERTYGHHSPDWQRAASEV